MAARKRPGNAGADGDMLPKKFLKKTDEEDLVEFANESNQMNLFHANFGKHKIHTRLTADQLNIYL